MNFIQKEGEKVWSEVREFNTFSHKEYKRIVQWWGEYLEKVNPDLEAEYEKIRMHQLGKSNPISPLWRNWASVRNTKVVIDFDYSGNLECQRNDKRDKQKKITDWEEQAFAAALMCCDTPWRTVAFLHEQFAVEHDLNFGQMMNDFHLVAHYVKVQMQIAFIGKHTLNFPRPSDYEFIKGKKKTLSLIPHPNHSSLPSGHSDVSQSVKKLIPQMYPNINVSKHWLQLCDDCGIARITAGIHWFADHEASIAAVNQFDKLAQRYAGIG